MPPAMLPAGLQHLVAELPIEPGSDIDDGSNDNSYMDIVMSAKGVSAIGNKDLSLKETLNSVEKEMISRALNEVDGNVSMCARVLKVQRTTLIERLKKYSLG
jgi:transcriptional regulator with PAS, ATPase and Fis domain